MEGMGYWAFPGKHSLQLSPHEHWLLLGGILCCAMGKVQKIPNDTSPKMHVTHQVRVVVKGSSCCLANAQDAGLVGRGNVAKG